MSFLDAMRDYFLGERIAGFVLVGVGVAALAFGLYLWRSAHSGGFLWGMLVPLALIGLGGVGGGLFLALKTPAQVAALERAHAASPGELLSTERPRMKRVNKAWPIIKAVWAVLILASLVCLFTVERDWVLGVALVILLAASTLMMFDVFAERRAAVYTQALDKLAGER